MSPFVPLGRVFVGASLCASFFLPALALPWLDLGVWRQVETTAVGLHVVSALCALGLAFLVWGRDEGASAALRSPVVLALLALAAWSAVVAPASDDVARSFFGTVQHGVGIVWTLELAVLAAGALAVSAARGWRTALYGSAAAAVVGCLALNAVFHVRDGVPFVPYEFLEYVGVHGLLAALPLFFLRSRAAWAIGGLLLAAALVQSENRAVVLAVIAAAGSGLLVHRLSPTRPALARGMAASAGVVVAIGGLAVMLVAQPIVERTVVSQLGETRVPGIPSENPLDHVEVQETAFGTVWSRSLMARLVAADLLESPTRLVHGRGWGAFETVSLESAGEVPGRRFDQSLPTAGLAYWDGAEKAKFHSHNMAMEAALATGVPGLLFWLAVLAAIPLSAGRERLAQATAVSVALAVIGTFWFFVNTAAPLLALAMAASIGRPTAVRIVPRLVAVPFLAAVLGFQFSATAAYGAAATSRFERYFTPMIPTEVPACLGMTSIAMPEVEHNAALYLMLARKIESAEYPFVEVAMRSANVRNFSCVMRTYSEAAPNVLAMDASLRARAVIVRALGTGPALESVIGVDLRLWGDDIREMLKVAPSRTDVIIPYLDWLSAAGDDARLKREIESLLPVVGERDPVAWWLRARLADLRGEGQASANAVAKSLRLGYANVFPVSEQAVAEALAKANGS